MKNKNIFSFSLVLFSLILCSCKPGSKEDTQQSITSSSENQLVEKVIGVDGGQITDEETGLSLNIPSGALTADTKISVKYADNEKQLSEGHSMGFLAGAEFFPSGLQFEKPVEVTLPISKTPNNTQLSVFCYDENYDIWDFVSTGSIGGNNVKFNIKHFSRYESLDINPEMLNKYVDLVYEANRSNKPNTWITQSYKEYLINEKHVMEYYDEFEGYYYEPCGLLISGTYEIGDKEAYGNDMTEFVGESNKDGNKLGYSQVASETVRTMDTVTADGSPIKNEQDSIHVLVNIDYKMIKPQIVLSSPKTSLAKGDSTTINVYCHYANPSNTIYPDIILANYNLYIEIPVHYQLDKNNLVTDNDGRASFTVTAKDDEANETIKVVFEVTGPFGTRSEGTIALNSDADYKISGHIEEEYTFSYNVKTTSSVVVSKEGTFEMTIAYDFDGNFTVEEGIISGALSYMNVSVMITSSETTATNPPHANVAHYDVFKSVIDKTINTPSFSFVGSKSEEGVCSITNADEAELLSLNGQGEYYYEGMGSYPLYYSLSVSVGSAILLNFELNKGEETYSSQSFKDVVKTFNVGDGAHNEPIDQNAMVLTRSNVSGKTTQTITIE